MTPQEAWDTVDVLLELFRKLTLRTRNRLRGNPLERECLRFQEVFTDSSTITDLIALELGSTLLKLFRLRKAFISLAGHCTASSILQSSASHEREDLFSMDVGASDARIYALYTAALLNDGGCGEVVMIPAETEDGAATPDFEIVDVGYGECKDLRTTTPDGVWNNLWTNLQKADSQLGAAQTRASKSHTLSCVDLPSSAGPDRDAILQDALTNLWSLLPQLAHTQAVLLSVQWINASADGQSVEFPYHWRLVRNPSGPSLDQVSTTFLCCVFPDGWYVPTLAQDKYREERCRSTDDDALS
jgi:hypothetical protein